MYTKCYTVFGDMNSPFIFIPPYKVISFNLICHIFYISSLLLYFIVLSFVIALPTIAIAIDFPYLFCITLSARKSDKLMTKWEAIQKIIKKLIPKIKQITLRASSVQSFLIFLSQYWKTKEYFVYTNIFSVGCKKIKNCLTASLDLQSYLTLEPSCSPLAAFLQPSCSLLAALLQPS